MINTETNPQDHPDAMRAMRAAICHHQAIQEWGKTGSPAKVFEVQAWAEIREDHQKKTGWVAEHQGEGEWVFTYMDPTQVDPDTGYKTGQPVTITNKEAS